MSRKVTAPGSMLQKISRFALPAGGGRKLCRFTRMPQDAVVSGSTHVVP
jgi:hypothetical protein